MNLKGSSKAAVIAQSGIIPALRKWSHDNYEKIRNGNLPNIGSGIYSYTHLLGLYISSYTVVRIFSNTSKLDFFKWCKVIAL